MRFMQLVPGTGHFYCGSCLRDDALARALQQLGHEVDVVPLYLPRVVENSEADAEAEAAASSASRPRALHERVHMGGINMYLQQKLGAARHLPRWLADLLDHPRLLAWAARRGSMTQAPGLGAMVVSMLRGESGRQRAELDKLASWMASVSRPDVVVLSNALLCGVVRRIKAVLDCPVVVTLQGEPPFLDVLPPPHREQAWQVLRERAADVDAFVAVSATHGEVMRARLGVQDDRVHVVHNGLHLDGYTAEPLPLAARRPPTVGYLARMCRDKGLPTLVEAFVRLAQRGRVEGVRLRAAGVVLAEDRPLLAELQRSLRRAGLEDRAEFLPDVDRAAKLALLRSLSVLSVPATCGEAFGLYLLEAMACGVPVVQPRHGAFPEILAATGGGVLCEPDDAASLAERLEELLRDGRRSQELAASGRRAVLERFHARRMGEQFAAVCASVVGATRVA